MNMQTIVTNLIDEKEYFISVVPTKKSSLMVEIAGSQAKDLANYRIINFEAFIYKKDEIDLLNNLDADAAKNEFFKSKPALIIFLGENPKSLVTDQGLFQDIVNKIVTNADIDNDSSIINLLSGIGYKVSIQQIYSPFCSANVRTIYIYIASDKYPTIKPYLDDIELEERRIAFIHCEDEENCGFILEFTHPNCTFFYCKQHNKGFNVDLSILSDTGYICPAHGPTERYDLLSDDNVCPSCEASMLAIISVGI